MEFETTDDLEHLPNSTALKTYMRCCHELAETVDTKSNKLLLTKIGNYFADLNKEEKEIYLAMSKGCAKRLKPITDRIEWSYAFYVCWKQNDNEVN